MDCTGRSCHVDPCLGRYDGVAAREATNVSHEVEMQLPHVLSSATVYHNDER
jgi:hypothetical protein